MKKATFHSSRREALGVLGAVLYLPRTAFGPQLATVTGRAFGTFGRPVATTASNLTPARNAIESLFAKRTDSGNARFNAMPAGLWARDTGLADVTAAALDTPRQCNAAFDLTVGLLAARWGFAPIREGVAPDRRGTAATPGALSKSRDDLTLSPGLPRDGRSTEPPSATGPKESTIDTRTAELVSVLRSVTVVASDAMSADGWATALCAVGAGEGPDLARSKSLAALFLIETKGTLRTVITGPLHEAPL
jgi:thiamine biosynthesis lipoprotein